MERRKRCFFLESLTSNTDFNWDAALVVWLLHGGWVPSLAVQDVPTYYRLGWLCRVLEFTSSSHFLADISTRLAGRLGWLEQNQSSPSSTGVFSCLNYAQFLPLSQTKWTINSEANNFRHLNTFNVKAKSSSSQPARVSTRICAKWSPIHRRLSLKTCGLITIAVCLSVCVQACKHTYKVIVVYEGMHSLASLSLVVSMQT